MCRGIPSVKTRQSEFLKQRGVLDAGGRAPATAALQVYLNQNTLGTLMLSEAVGLDKDAPYGGLDLYLIPKDPSLYAKPSLVNEPVQHLAAFGADQPLPRFDWSKLEYPRFGPFKFYIGSHLE